MKKYLCILILALCASLLPVSPALADTVSWVRITQDNTRFYRNPTNMDADIMFELEKSYYLKVVSEQSYFYQVELMDNDNGFVKIYGYVKKTDVTPAIRCPSFLYITRFTFPSRAATPYCTAPAARRLSRCARFSTVSSSTITAA